MLFDDNQIRQEEHTSQHRSVSASLYYGDSMEKMLLATGTRLVSGHGAYNGENESNGAGLVDVLHKSVSL